MNRLNATGKGKIGLGISGKAKKSLTAEESQRLVDDIMEKFQIGKTDTEKRVTTPKPKARLNDMTEQEKRAYLRKKAIEAKKKKKEDE